MLLYKAHFLNCSNGKHTTVFYGHLCGIVYCTCVKKSVCRFFFMLVVFASSSSFFLLSIFCSLVCVRRVAQYVFPPSSFQISSNLQTLVWIFLYTTKKWNLDERKNHKLCRMVEYPMRCSWFVCVWRVNRVSTKE